VAFFTPILALSKLATGFRRLTGWRRLGSAFLFGALGALVFPPLDLFPVFWICFPVLVWLLQGTTNLRSAFTIGWFFAFGNLAAGLYWIAAAMFVDIKTFWWAVPLAVAGLPACFAIYNGAAMALARRIGVEGLSGSIVVGLSWFLADYVRGHAFSGFPWNLEAYGWDAVLPVLQLTSITGAYGLALLTLVAACLGASLADGTRRGQISFTMGILVFVALDIWGSARLDFAKDAAHRHPDVPVRLVQPNTNQAKKWLADNRERDFQKLLDLSSTRAPLAPALIVWPETASTYYLAEDALHRHRIATMLPINAHLITGVIRREEDLFGLLHYYNSMVVIDDRAQIDGSYDKSHLVPFGEYMPYRKYIPLPSLINMNIDFSTGMGAHSLHVKGLPSFSPFICYEAIFPGILVNESDRPEFLLNITNDGWYGNTSGPYQHFASARVRAIEEGLPLVRAANTGISAIVDALGRVVVSIPLGIAGSADADLPATQPPTYFSLHKEAPLWTLFGVILVGAFLGRFLRK